MVGGRQEASGNHLVRLSPRRLLIPVGFVGGAVL